jgi:hypothetical protein
VSYWSFINFLQWSSVKPTQVSSAQADRHWRHLKGKIELNSAFEKADRLLDQGSTGSQYDKNGQLTLLSHRKLAFTGRNMQMALQNSEGHLKKIKTRRDAYLRLYLYICVIKSPIQLVSQSL